MAGAVLQIRAVVVAPTFNNAGTLGHVLTAVRALGLTVIVVNDGSTDQTIELLAALTHASPGADARRSTSSACAPASDFIVLAHPHNRGKAAAMRTGFEAAVAAGYTHAMTIDTDGQHHAADIPTLIAACCASPRALVLGTRPREMSGCPAASNAGRRISNFLVKIEAGVTVDDSQCGLRVYPLHQTLALPAGASRFGFETEILVRFGWAQLPVAEVPVRCDYEVPGGRVTHFRRGPDSLAAVRMHARLMARSLYLVPPKALAAPATSGTICQRFLRWMNPAVAWRSIRHSRAERPRYAAAFSVGVMIANLPIYGVQSLLSLFVAKRLKLPPLAVLAGSHVSTPPFGPLLIALAIGVGHFLLHGEYLSLGDFDLRHIGYLRLLRAVAMDWVVGGIACGAAMAALTYVLARLTLGFVPLTSPQTPAR